MKNMKKLYLLVLALVFTVGLTACGGDADSAESTDETSSVEETNETTDETSEVEESSEETSETTGEALELDENSLYLVTDLGTIDDKSFNQGSFEGLKQYADEVGLEAKYIRPQGEGEQIYIQTIEQAINAGAKIVVTPGFLFDTAVGKVQDQYPDVKFITVDFEPTVDGAPIVGDNTTSIKYKEEQSGFLAGYAAVKDGYTKLGFMGGIAVPAVIKYGFGFVAGANYAAEEMGVDVEVKYNYTGSFSPTPEIQTMASSWYQSGTEVIFSCGGGIATSVLKAAQDNDAKMIGVDVDQKDMGEQVITSAMKNLQGSVYDAVKSAAEGTFTGGETLELGVEHDGVQISDDFSRFNTFTEEEYTTLFQELIDNKDGITDSIPVINYDLEEAEQGNPELIMDNYNNVKLEYILQ